MTMTKHPKVRRPNARAGFTLVEMLVVIAIIGVLAALLIPAVNSAMILAKNAAMATDIANVANAVEKYKSEKGDYPPSLGESTGAATYGGAFNNGYSAADEALWNNSVLRRHIVTAYPKIDTNELLLFRRLASHLSQSEALVFFLSLTRDDPRYPFFGASYPGRATILTDLANANFVPLTRDDTNLSPYKSYGFEFDKNRLYDSQGVNDLDDVPSCVGKNCKAAVYIYMDAKTYGMHFRDLENNSFPPSAACGENRADNNSATDLTRPYFSNDLDVALNRFKYQNAQSFQIVASGLDGRFTTTIGTFANPQAAEKRLPSKRTMNPQNHADAAQDRLITQDEWVDDRDNVANFTNGKRFDDLAP
jgi:prepilin-type N-terminal cleavage/methylation domain-containing protein